jgi:hypothetical protein
MQGIWTFKPKGPFLLKRLLEPQPARYLFRRVMRGGFKKNISQFNFVVIRKVPVKYVPRLYHHEDHEGCIVKFSYPLFVIFVVDKALPGLYA